MNLVVRGGMFLASILALTACLEMEGGEGGEREGEGDEGSAAASGQAGSGTPAGSSGGSCSAGSSTSGAGSTMQPGGACIACHSQGEGPRFTVAGTVMGGYGEATGCNGVSGAQVVITDAAGQTLTLAANGAGNFYTSAPVSFPITAKVLSGGKVLAMASPQSSGDCNGCHTATGSSGAPGRIVMP